MVHLLFAIDASLAVMEQTPALAGCAMALLSWAFCCCFCYCCSGVVMVFMGKGWDVLAYCQPSQGGYHNLGPGFDGSDGVFGYIWFCCCILYMMVHWAMVLLVHSDGSDCAL
ncbi:hypothetical protein U1Q18_017354 [Sarracenia purpurea var. burkii]